MTISMETVESTALQTLRSKLQTQAVRKDAAGQEPRRFIPKGSLQEILKGEDMTSILKDPRFRIPWHKLETTKSIVLEAASKVFAILVDLELETRLTDFIEHDLLDKDLPASKDRLGEILQRTIEVSSFAEIQWEYVAYRIRKAPYHKTIQESTILPYLEQTKIGGGGFSKVYKVIIHPRHQDLYPELPQKCEGVTVVRKEIDAPATHERTSREAELLFLLGSLKHQNIVELLASYRHNAITSLLFPLAESDLHAFLLRSCRPTGLQEDFQILEAAHGLSSGLLYLHRYPSRPDSDGSSNEPSLIGYHHDIKPRNVLIQNSSFVLADFGLSKLRPESEDSKTQWKDTTFEYGAPECRNMETFAPGRVGRALDIWSLGCVLSEVETYLQRGAEGVGLFREKRVIEHTHGQVRCFHDGKSISDNVSDWFEDLEHQITSTAQLDLMSLLRDALRGQADERLDAKPFEEKMSYIAIESLLEAVIYSIDSCINQKEPNLDRNVYQIRLALEKGRLEAWAGVLGLLPIGKRQRPNGTRAETPVAESRAILLASFEQLKNPGRFDNTKDNQDLILNTLYCMNNDLCRNLSPKTRASIDKTFEILVTSNPADLSLPAIERATLQESAPRYGEIGNIAAMKYMSLQLTESASKLAPGTVIQKSLIRMDKEKDNPELRPQTFWYSYHYLEGKEERVVVEWRGYGIQLKKAIEGEEFRRIGEALFQRNQELVSVLKHQPKLLGFRVLECIGTFQDPEQEAFGIVYKYPRRDVVSARLNALLRHGKKRPLNPDPNRKLLLAKALVVALQSFHVSGWVHKNLTPYNVLFFPTSVAGWKGLDLSEPYIVGFHHSRKDEIGQYSYGLTEDIKVEYQHPDYKPNTSYHKHYDYYSLGLLLLEIGLWASLSEIYNRFPELGSHELAKEYVKYCRNDLKQAMGQIYSTVTIRCLESDTLKDPLDFQREVVEKLESCVW